MDDDLYAILGLTKKATKEEIKRTYRKLASKLHPDRNPGNKEAEARFKKINHAFQVLSDPNKRKLYDEFGHAGLSEGFNPDRAKAYQQWSSRGANPFGGIDIEELFGGRGVGDMIGDLFGRSRGTRRGRPTPARGPDIESELSIDFAAAVRGTTISLRLDGSESQEPVQVRIPPGAMEGSKLRVRGNGGPAPMGGQRGDLILRIRVRPHDLFRMEGKDLHLDLPTTPLEAYAGASVRIPTPDGAVTLRVPPGTQSGNVVRLRGKGIAQRGKENGDLYVHFRVVLPTEAQDDVRKAIETLDGFVSAEQIRSGLVL